jgi:hypothetical protein
MNKSTIAVTSIFVMTIFATNIFPNGRSIAQSKQINLTGNWNAKNIPETADFTYSNQGCTAGFDGEIIVTVDGKKPDEKKPKKINQIKLRQEGGKLIFPTVTNTSISITNTTSFKINKSGFVSGNKVQIESIATPDQGGTIRIVSTGTISDDGNAIKGKTICTYSKGQATAQYDFTWQRVSNSTSSLINLSGNWNKKYIPEFDGFTLDNRGCTAGINGEIKVTVDGQSRKRNQVTLKQVGNKLIFPTYTIIFSELGRGGSYELYTSGVVSGNKVQIQSVAMPELGRTLTKTETGIISDDGNSIKFKTTCMYSGGQAIAEVNSIWQRTVKSTTSHVEYTTLQPKPDRNSINQGLTPPSPKFMEDNLGTPGKLSANCTPMTNANLKKLMVREDVGPFKVEGLKPAVAAIRRIFDKVKIEKPELYKQLNTDGMLCVREVRQAKVFSNHSWGATIDIKINKKQDVRGDNKTLVGLKELYPYFHAEKFYWGAAFPIEDSMHFEASRQLIEEWIKSGDIPKK